jgi:hypothetical protein
MTSTAEGKVDIYSKSYMTVGSERKVSVLPKSSPNHFRRSAETGSDMCGSHSPLVAKMSLRDPKRLRRVRMSEISCGMLLGFTIDKNADEGTAHVDKATLKSICWQEKKSQYARSSVLHTGNMLSLPENTRTIARKRSFDLRHWPRLASTSLHRSN